MGKNDSSKKKDEITHPLCEHKTDVLEKINAPTSKIEIRQSNVHGYGVFATQKIDKNEFIEDAKLLALKFRSKYTNEPVLNEYVWTNYSCNCNKCLEHGFRQYIALGFGSLYNHKDEPNTIQDINFTTELLSIKARIIIMKDEEIFVDYGKMYWVLKKFWKDMPEETLDKIISKQQKYNR